MKFESYGHLNQQYRFLGQKWYFAFQILLGRMKPLFCLQYLLSSVTIVIRFDIDILLYYACRQYDSPYQVYIPAITMHAPAYSHGTQ